MPPEESFTALFCAQAQHILHAAQELRQMVVTGANGDSHVAANRTFNAPIDREDILQLAHLLDDAVDLIEDTAKGIQRYAVASFPPEMWEMADAIVQSAERLRKVMPYLDSVTKDHAAIFALCEEIGQIEGRADDSFDRALSALRTALRAGQIDTIGYIDRKELYELVEHVVDKCDDIANAVQSITAKHV